MPQLRVKVTLLVDRIVEFDGAEYEREGDYVEEAREIAEYELGASDEYDVIDADYRVSWSDDE